MSELDTWVVAACAELGLDSDDVPVKQILDLAKDVAHQVIRPGAPVSAFLLGIAVGHGADAAETAEKLSALALSWPQRAEPQDQRAEPQDQRAEPQDQRAEPYQQRAEPQEQRAEPQEQRAEPQEQRAEPQKQRAEQQKPGQGAKDEGVAR